MSKVMFSVLKEYLNVKNRHESEDRYQHTLRHELAQGRWPDEADEATEARRN